MKQLQVGGQAAFRVDNDPDRAVAFAFPHRELRIVMHCCPGTHDDRIEQRPHPVVMPDIDRARYIMRCAAFGRDPPIQTLAQMPDHERPLRFAERQI